jgi:hypothetical protein
VNLEKKFAQAQIETLESMEQNPVNMTHVKWPIALAVKWNFSPWFPFFKHRREILMEYSVQQYYETLLLVILAGCIRQQREIYDFDRYS